MKALITGGAGFIGSRLALRLLERGYAVTVLDSLSPQVHTQEPELSGLYRSILGKVHFIRGDVTDQDQLAAALADQEVVIHFAAETGTGQSMYRIEHYSRINIGGTSLLLDILANSRHSVKKIVVASSRAVYGEGKYLSAELGPVYPQQRLAVDMSAGDFEVKHPGCSAPLVLAATDEESRLHPSSVYGVTKQVQEQLVMTVCPALGVAPVAFRYQNVYGPGQSLSNPYTGILSIFSNRLLRGEPINIFEDGAESRDFVYVDDVVAATVLGIERSEADHQVFNVGSGVPVSVLAVARALAQKLQAASVPIRVSGDFRLGDIRHNYGCLAKIRARLGYSPTYDFDRGLTLFCDWVRSASSTDSAYEQSLEEMRRKGLLMSGRTGKDT